MLDFRIATFLKLCETRSYTNTAKLLHITQPSVTQHIKYMQKRYQCKLFSYEGKTLRLTPEGEYLQRQAQELTRLSTKIVEDLRRMSEKCSALRFGVDKAFGEQLVPRIVASMLSENRELELELHMEDTRTLLEMLEEGRLDFILTDAAFAKANFACRSIGKEKFCCWASAEREGMLHGRSLQRLFGERLLLQEESAASRMLLEQLLQQRNSAVDDFYAVMRCNTSGSICELTAAGTGIAFDYACTMEEAVKQGRVRKLALSDFAEDRKIALMYLQYNPQAEAFQEFLKAFEGRWKSMEKARESIE